MSNLTHSLRLPMAGIMLLVLSMLSGCSTYDKVAVWYKYRKDFKLPKEQVAHNRTTAPRPAAEAQAAQPEAPAVATQEAAAEPALAQTEPQKMSRREVRKALRQARHEARAQARTQPAKTADAVAYASGKGGTQVEVDSRPVWERAVAQPEAAKQSGDSRPFHWAAIAGLISSLLWFLGPVGIVFAIVGFILSLIGLLYTGPSRSYRGQGLALAGLIIGAIGVLLWLVVIAAVF